ncbi:MAG: hypothetical protein ACRDK1_03610 [Solirubrobacterales bacterium]
MESSTGGKDRGEGLRRGLAALLFVVLAFGCAVMLVSMADISQTPTCHDVQFNGATPNDGQCFDGTSLQKVVSLTLGFASGALAGIGGVLAILFAITGRRGRLLVALSVAALGLGVVSVVAGSV